MEGLPGGRVQPAAREELLRLLKECWDAFKGSNSEGMAAYKLQRAEDLTWEPPPPLLRDREA